VTQTLDFHGEEELQPNEVYGVAFGEGSLWVGGGGLGRVLRIDPETGDVEARIDVGAQAVDLDVGEGGLWVGTVAERAVHIETRTNDVVARVAISLPLTVVVAEGTVWVGDCCDANGAGRIWKIDPETATAQHTIPIDADPIGIAAGGGSVWVTSSVGTVVRIDAETSELDEVLQLGYEPVEAVLADGQLWITVVEQVT
jgi:streptogramin lyase